jgi:hypothetical protein
MTPGLVYRLAGWRGSEAIGEGQLVVRASRRGSARLSYHNAQREGRAECLQRQDWALGVIALCHTSRATLREESCLSHGDPACEYVVTWTDDRRLVPAVLSGLVVAIVLTSTPLPAAAPAVWLLVPTVVAAMYALEQRRMARANPPAVAQAGAAFHSLVTRLLARNPALVGTASPANGVSLEQQGAFWRIGYEGTTVLLRHSRGLALLAHLIRNPGQEVHVSDLDAMTPSGGSAEPREAPAPDGGLPPTPGDAGELLDAQARTEYRRRIAELREELGEAEARHDLGRVEEARAELELLEDEIRAAVGSGGRVRRAGADAERLRVSITRRIRSAMTQIAKHHPALGAHLAASVSTGYRCAYQPAVGQGPAGRHDPKA